MKAETAIATTIVLALTVSLYAMAYRRTRTLILRGYLVGWRYDALLAARARRRPEDEAWANRNQAVRDFRIGALVAEVDPGPGREWVEVEGETLNLTHAEADEWLERVPLSAPTEYDLTGRMAR